MKRCHFCFRRLPLFTLLRRALLLSVCSLIVATVHGAPVKLQFDAIVGPPRQGSNGLIPPVPPSWGISLQQGDIISGTFTFDPVDVPSNTAITRIVQPYDFTFQIKTQTLTTSQYGMEVYDDSRAVDGEGINPSDNMYIGCSAGINTPSCLPAILSTPDTLTWSFQMILVGYPSVLDGADIPALPATWQQLNSEGSIVVLFTDNAASKSYGFRARQQSFRAVPEPSSGFVCMSGFVVYMCNRRSKSQEIDEVTN